jgi:hypothetical protein
MNFRVVVWDEFLDLNLFDLISIKKQSFGAKFWFWGCSFKKEFLYNHNSQLFVFILYYIRVSLLLVFDFTLMKGYGVKIIKILMLQLASSRDDWGTKHSSRNWLCLVVSPNTQWVFGSFLERANERKHTKRQNIA